MTQTRFTVLYETQRHPDLAGQIDRILHRVGPTVKEISSLPLPQEARFRLLTPEVWREETRKSQHGTLARDIAGLELVHQVQADARNGELWGTFFPQRRETTVVGASAVLKGHAACEFAPFIRGGQA
ncbi:hypothetical protein AB0945_21285 [Streptomyces sp. NPDC005474]|uniref:hypothetical protein n=1 Tax=Streptomyces sp. NPDC005474 TaxID=3154878 RepID=UPI0034541794